MDLPAYDRDRIHHARIGAADVHAAAGRLLTMTHAERKALPFMHPGRVDCDRPRRALILDAPRRAHLSLARIAGAGRSASRRASRWTAGCVQDQCPAVTSPARCMTAGLPLRGSSSATAAARAVGRADAGRGGSGRGRTPAGPSPSPPPVVTVPARPTRGARRGSQRDLPGHLVQPALDLRPGPLHCSGVGGSSVRYRSVSRTQPMSTETAASGRAPPRTNSVEPPPMSTTRYGVGIRRPASSRVAPAKDRSAPRHR
ncbi:hypothetical protein SAMN04489717_0004 [Actinopolymorpha singaporensis]|uniref:Uncharacterized protein n=1 Tax=Actinopolymorpha singaporensis TaxID=117157 RepID=A0A1H1L012_9ACTN|nr:hypothetical protein SAMN04489717_0004 [Actinopolymorpha singaporensis]